MENKKDRRYINITFTEIPWTVELGVTLSFILKAFIFKFLFFFFLSFLGPHPWHIEVPRLGVKS